MKNKIAYYRKNRKLTQEELAKLIGVSRQTIISLESGKFNPNLELAYTLAKFFHMSIEELFILNKRDL